MKWLPLLAAAFIAIPITELTLLLLIAQASGHWWVSLLLVVTTGLLGATLARWQGRAVWNSFVSTVRQGKLPTDELVDGAIIFFAAGLLLTPGVLTDGVGLLMLVPGTRAVFRNRIKQWLGRRFKVQVGWGSMPNAAPGDSNPEVIDASARRVDEP